VVDRKRLESIWIGRDFGLLDAMLGFYAPRAALVVDVACSTRKMWRGAEWASQVIYFDMDRTVDPDAVADWGSLPLRDTSVDVLVYDPPHLPVAAASPRSNERFWRAYGLQHSVKGDNIAGLHPPFLREAKRVLKPDGVVLAKIKDYVHNHRYQWNLEAFNQAVRESGMTPCDLVIKRDPAGGKLMSGRWRRAYHARNVHCYWAVVRNGGCEPKRRRIRC